MSNVIIVKEKDLDNEGKLEWLGKENTNLIQSEINKSSKEVIKYLREIRGDGPTALGPAVLLSLYLLNKAETGSRIFLCTDGLSNRGVGNINNKDDAIQFYKKIGDIAKEKGIAISLISFEDSKSEINI